MVQLKYTIKKSGKVYLSLYHGKKFLRYLGKEENYTPEKLNYIKRKEGERLNETK